MAPPLQAWMWEYIEDRFGELQVDFVNGFEMAVRLDPPLDRSNQNVSAARDLFDRFRSDDTFAFDLVDYALYLAHRPYYAQNMQGKAAELHGVLLNSGSVWEVSLRPKGEHGEHGGFCLTKRDLAEAKRSVERLREVPGRAGDFLAAAWNSLAGRNPQPSDAYDKAVKAVEAAMHPVVSPSDSKATLGKMRSVLRDKPSKWIFQSPVSPDLVVTMAGDLWEGHLRHGSDERFSDEGGRTDHTMVEADGALHLAIALVGFFQRGLVTSAQ